MVWFRLVNKISLARANRNMDPALTRLFLPLCFCYFKDVMPRCVTIVVGLLLLLLSSVPVASQSAITPIRLKSSPTLAVMDMGSWKSVYKGIAFRKMTLERSEPNHSIDLKLFRFDSQWILPRA